MGTCGTSKCARGKGNHKEATENAEQKYIVQDRNSQAKQQGQQTQSTLNMKHAG